MSLNVRADAVRSLHNRLEQLERRDLLTAAPRVVAVEIGSSSWSDEFVSYLQDADLGSAGYAVPVGTTAQSSALTWTGLDQIHIRFNEDVVIQAADLSLSGINQTAYAFAGFHYDPQEFLATWTLAQPLERDRIRIDLDANGADPVVDLSSNALDGEWVNNSYTLSGNGTAGGDFEFNLNVLPTDVNNSASVTSLDYVYIRQLEGKTTTHSGYQAKRDIDGNGVIDNLDWQEAIDRYFQALPAGTPAGASNDAPTTNGIELLVINDDTTNFVESLLDDFYDAVGGSSSLNYTILSNSNPSLFDSVSINTSTDQLVLNTASNVSGRATLTLRAMDAGGLFVDTTVTVDVDRTNLAPYINVFNSHQLGPGTYRITGQVVDPDDDVDDLIIEITGELVTLRAAVDEDGYFEFVIVVPEDAFGWQFAETVDAHALESNLRELFVAPI